MALRGSDVLPPLEHVQTVPLLEATQSRLTLLAKRAVGPECSTWNIRPELKTIPPRIHRLRYFPLCAQPTWPPDARNRLM